MFAHQSKPIIIPQRNHAHLAGNLAVYWGNSEFDFPDIPLETIVKGICFHQNGYVLFDAKPVTKMTDNVLIKVFKDDFNVELEDVDAELINMFHQHRLVSGIVEREGSSAFIELKNEFESAIDIKLEKSSFQRDDFLWANRITHLCDKLSFNFCFGNEKPERVELFKKADSRLATVSTHHLKDDTIYLSPWPFAVDQIRSTVIAYESGTYPDKLVPHLLSLVVKRAEEEKH